METFSQTADITSICLLMQMTAQYNLIVYQTNVKTAYLYALIDYEIYMERPERFEVKWNIDKKLVCILNKFLYNLKCSGRNWNKTLHDCLIKIDFVQNQIYYCIYTRHNNNKRIIIISRVDDLILAADNMDSLNNIKQRLTSEFNVMNVGKLCHFLGIDFNITKGLISMKSTPQRY